MRVENLSHLRHSLSMQKCKKLAIIAIALAVVVEKRKQSMRKYPRAEADLGPYRLSL